MATEYKHIYSLHHVNFVTETNSKFPNRISTALHPKIEKGIR